MEYVNVLSVSFRKGQDIILGLLSMGTFGWMSGIYLIPMPQKELFIEN